MTDEASPRTKGACRCTNPECEYGGRWVVGKMKLMGNGRLRCTGRGCHSIHDANEVIDSENEDQLLRSQPREVSEERSRLSGRSHEDAHDVQTHDQYDHCCR